MQTLLASLSLVASAADLNPLDMRWTFGAHEPYTMYRRIGKHSTGGVDGNARWVKPWLDWWDAEAPAHMKELGLNWLHSRFYKGMGWEIEKKDFPNVKKFVANCHANGVRALAYVQFATLYPEIMKAEIPEVDSWAQVNEKGEPNFYFGGGYFRVMPCLHCREWVAYLKRLCTIALTEGGFDGIMFDNAFSRRCFCARCQKSFTAHLLAQPNKAERFGFEDLSNFRLPRFDEKDVLGKEVRDPVIQAWLDWRAETTTAVFRELRAHIKSVKGDAVVAANASPFRRQNNVAALGVDMVALAGVYDLIIGQSANYPAYAKGRLCSRIRDLKMARELRRNIVALCDSDAKMTPEQEAHYLLPLFEDLVFGGVPTDRTVIAPKAVPGFLDKAKFARRKRLIADFNRLVAANRAALEAPVYQPVRLFCPVHEHYYSPQGQQALAAAEEICTRRQVPWGYLVSTAARPCEIPAGTEVIVVAGQLSLSEAQVKGLVAWAKAGGKLVVTGDAGRYDGFNAQHLVNPLLPRLEGLPNVAWRAAADVVSPCRLGWAYEIGAPKDHGKVLLADLAKTGWRAPFALEGIPETVALDVRTLPDGTRAFHFVNFDPSHPVEGAAVILADGRRLAVPKLVEYALVRE